MSFKDNQDLRVRGNGGWFWGEHELFTVFAPIIGPVGVAVYIAMARQIPLAGIDSDKPIRVRRVSEFSCVGRSKCAEEMRKIIQLGMVIETKYLDGREPTYKLASLQDLAKVGQKELLARIGVRNTDTAPHDQAAKHRRERAARDAKMQETSALEAQTRDLPLLDQPDQAEEDGVRTADTEDNEAKESSGVRNTDTVSTKTAFVSAKSHSVSAESAFVSAGADTLKEESREEETINPLPPAVQGEVEDPDQARPSLPTEDCLFGDDGFEPALPHAARWVMAALGITKRGFDLTIVLQLRVYCRNNRSVSLQEAAALMARQGRKLHEDAALLRHKPWGWVRFIGEGHWTRPLPYDSAALRSDANVGMRVTPVGLSAEEQERADAEAAAEEASAQEYRRKVDADRLQQRREKIATYIAGCAGAILGASGPAVIAAKLFELEARVLSADALAEAAIDQELQDLEAEMVEAVKDELASVDPDGLESMKRWAANQALGLPPGQIRDEAKGRFLHKILRGKLPSLSLFYLPKS